MKEVKRGVVGSQHLYVKGKIFDCDIRAFIDSGSAVSLVSTEFIRKKGLSKNVTPSNILIRSFSKDKIPIDGEVLLMTEFAERKIMHRFLVSQYVEFELLIGLDYLKVAEMIIDVPGRCLHVGKNRTMFIQRPSSITRIAKIRIVNNEIIEPGTVNYIEAKMPGYRTEPSDRYGLFEGKDDPNRLNLIVADSVNYTKGYNLKVQVYNMGNKPIVLNRGDIIGKLCPLLIETELYGVHKVTNSNIENEQSIDQIENIDEWTKDELFRELEVSEMKIKECEKDQLKDIVWKYRKCFSKSSADLGKCNIFEAHIELKAGAKEKWISSRPVPYKLRGVMGRQIETQLKAGVIEKYEGNSGFNSSLMLVKKPKSDEWRGVVDLRYVNSMTVPDRYEVPNMMSVLDRIGDATYLSTLDITCAFNQVPLSEESRPITAFSYNKQRYIYKVLIMGFINSSQIFCRVMDKIFKDCPYKTILAFLDDLIMSSKTVEEHLERLEYIMKRMIDVNLKFRPSKCKLFRNEVSFVGYKISKKGIQIDNARIEPILNLKPPTNRKEAQSVIGVLNFQRNFIKDFAKMARPLYKLLKKDHRFNWTIECQESFDALKKAMVSAPILKIQDLDKENNSYCIEVDSSGHAWGAVLSQGEGLDKRVIGYYSKCIPEYKRRQGASRLEFLGMYHALRHWRMYLWGNDVTIVTDCEALVNLETLFHRSSTVQQRQMLELADYRLTIRHVKGVLNVIPDFLSRYIAGNHVTVGTQTEIDNEIIENKRVYRIRIDDLKEHVKDFKPEIYTEDSNSKVLIPKVPIVNKVTTNDIVKYINNLETIYEGRILSTVKRVLYEVCTVSKEIESLKDEDVVYDQYPDDHLVKVVTIEDLKEATLKDDVLVEVVKWLNAGERPELIQAYEAPKELIALWKSFNKLSYHNGIVYLSWSALKPPFKERELIVVPYSLQERMLINYHCGLMSLHMGVEACYSNCVKRFWWSNMKKEFKLFIAACIKCQKVKQPKAYLKAPLKPVLYTEVGQAIAIDHLVPAKMGTSVEGYRYILTIVECFSNYLICIPVKTMTAKETVKMIIQHYILPFGCPLKIVTDNYPSLTSELFREILKQFAIVDRKVTPYMSQSNGKCEIQNKRIGAALRAVVPENDLRTWSKYVPYCTSALNCIKSVTTGFSANFIMFGRELRFPNEFFVDQEKENRKDDTDSLVPVKTKTYELYRLIRNVYYKVRKNSKQQAKYMKAEYDKGVRMKEFKVGDHVFVYRDGDKHKLGPRWVGPARIMKKLSVHNYIVLIDPIKQLYKAVSIQKIKEYKPNYYSQILKRGNSTKIKEKQPSIVNNSSQRIIDEEDTVYIKANRNTSVEMQEDRPVNAQSQSMAIPIPTPTIGSSGSERQGEGQIPRVTFRPIDPPVRERRPRAAHSKVRKPFPEGFQRIE